MDCQKLLSKLHACTEARLWVGARELESAWNECERGDWMLWIAAKAGIDRKLVVLAACDCAETALQYVPEGEDRPRIAIETARRWAAGECELSEVRRAADAADAADAAAAAAATYAAAADAAAATYAAAAAAAAYAAAAYAAAYAAAAAYGRHTTRKLCAEIVRKTIPFADLHAALSQID